MTDVGVTGLGADPVAEEGDWGGWGGAVPGDLLC